MGLVTTQPKIPLRCAVYARISPTPEGKAGENFSIKSQIYEMREKALKDFACQNPAEYIDKNYMGGTLDRPALDRLRDHIALKMYDVIIAYSPDRWTREPSDKYILNRELEKGGARIVYVTVTYEDSAEGELSEGVQDVVSRYEKRKFKERSRRCRRHKSREGFPHACCAAYGYLYKGQEFGVKGEYSVVKAQAKVVKWIFERAAEGISNARIARWLNEKGIPTQEGKQWYPNSVGQLLRKRLYYGEMIQNGVAIKVEAIVTRALWDKAHEAAAQNKIGKVGREPRHYLLSGLLWCASCGHRSETCPRRWFGGEGGSYRCGNRNPKNRSERYCVAPEISKATLEPVIWNAVWDAVCDPGLLWEMIEAYYDRVAGKKGKTKDPGVAQIDRARRLVQRAEKILADPDEPVPYEKAKADLDKARKELVAVEAARGSAPVLVMPERKDVEAASAAFRKMREGLKDFDLRRNALRLLIAKILYADRAAEIHCRLPKLAGNYNNSFSDNCNFIGAIPFVIRTRVA